MAPPGTCGYALRVDKQRKMLMTSNAPYHVINKPWARWFLLDCVGSGATVFNGEVFKAGCNFVPLYKTGGSDIDIAYQMTQKGYKSIACIKPHSIHEHKRCSNKQYNQLRESKKELKKSARVFFQRWGLEYVLLRM
jgi:hypothetical protein